MMEDLPLMQPCCKATKNASSAHDNKTVDEYRTSGECSLSWAGCGSQDDETFDSISLYSSVRQEKRDSTTNSYIIDTLWNAVAQIFDAFTISPNDIDLVSNVIEKAKQDFSIEMPKKMESAVEADNVCFEEEAF